MAMELNLDGMSEMEVDPVPLDERIKSLCSKMEQDLSDNLPKMETFEIVKEEPLSANTNTPVDDNTSSTDVTIAVTGARKRKQILTNLTTPDVTITTSTITKSTIGKNITIKDPTAEVQHPLDLLKSIPELTKLEVDVLDKPIIKNFSPAKARKISILSSSVSKLTIKDSMEGNTSESKSNSDQKHLPNLKSYPIEYTASRRFLKPLYLRPPDTPIERPRQMIRFLEGKRKHVHFDSLYHWVLWNENLKRAHSKRNNVEDVQLPCRSTTISNEKVHAMEREEKIRRDCSRGYLPLC